jgi:hypothetical protein
MIGQDIGPTLQPEAPPPGLNIGSIPIGPFSLNEWQAIFGKITSHDLATAQQDAYNGVIGAGGSIQDAEAASREVANFAANHPARRPTLAETYDALTGSSTAPPSNEPEEWDAWLRKNWILVAAAVAGMLLAPNLAKAL